ncbi:MAG: 2-C-methyl-D-erythritol 4-phosphate cytidylyltransferase [Bacteroidales bacterium]|jgi:2-C-methyl-D-erythritol 4-phosphate cytidylyltransferase|nr:2-C-methyl-D-erythritol 4-phosphate cytidylyltransferase [Bacteroidales bacterium]
MNIAIILAGGAGSRSGYDIPKQLVTVAGKTVLEHTVDVFENNAHIDEIAIVIHEYYINDIENIIIRNEWKKVKEVLQGGKERFDSSFSAIKAYKQFPNYNLIFHDAVRPLVSQRIINEVVESLENYNAVGVSIPVVDTIYEIDETQSLLKSIPVRSLYHRAQTPQGFKSETIHKAYQIAMQDVNFQSTDDCSVVANCLPEEKIFLVRGDETNRKMTYKEDLINYELRINNYKTLHTY